MERTVRVRGRGRAEVAAYGVADAEHLVEKEIGRCWPEARCTVLEVARAGAGSIVEEFAVSFLLEAALRAEGDTADAARREALRRARAVLSGTRYARTALEVVEVGPPESPAGG